MTDRCNDQAANLDLKADITPRVGIHNQPPNIPCVMLDHSPDGQGKKKKLTQNFRQTSQRHSNHKAPSFPSETLKELDAETCCEDDNEEDVGSKIGPIAIGGGLDGAKVRHFRTVIIYVAHLGKGIGEETAEGRGSTGSSGGMFVGQRTGSRD